MSGHIDVNDLHSKIEKLRDDMIKSGMTHGFVHPTTVKLSQQLDVLLNYYIEQSQKIKVKN